MIEILLALIAVVALSIWGANKGWTLFNDLVCPVFASAGFIGLLAYAAMAFSYLGAEYKANIINAEYGTNYTQEEVFYASSVIETVRELDRKRIEVNGDLITDR